MDTMDSTTNPTTKVPLRTSSPSRDVRVEMTKTPEDELMTVEEYFGILRKRVNEYYDNL